MIDRRAVRAIAGQEIVDGFRNRRQLVLRAVLPLLLFTLVLIVAFVTRSPEVQRVPERLTVAVEGDAAGAHATLADLPEFRLEVEPAPDAALAAARGADIGIVLPPGIDDALARGEQPRVVVYHSPGDRRSTTALALLDAAFSAQRKEQIDAQLFTADPDAVTSLFPVEVVDVELTTRGAQLGIAGLVGALVCIQAGLLTGGVGMRLAARRTGGRLVGQLLLPVGRAEIALAKGLAELGIGLVVALPVLVPATLVATVWQLGHHGAAAAVAALVAVVMAALVLSTTTTAVGLLVGVRARSQEQLTLASAATVIAMAAVGGAIALGSLPRPSALAVVPVAGIVSALRDVLAGSGNPVWFSTAVVTTLVPAVFLVHRAGQSLDAERLVLRGS